MIPLFQYLIYGHVHDWKCRGINECYVRKMGIENDLYNAYFNIICQQCTKCKKLKFSKSNGYYEKLEIE